MNILKEVARPLQPSIFRHKANNEIVAADDLTQVSFFCATERGKSELTERKLSNYIFMAFFMIENYYQRFSEGLWWVLNGFTIS